MQTQCPGGDRLMKHSLENQIFSENTQLKVMQIDI